jgi:hypothetical protein
MRPDTAEALNKYKTATLGNKKFIEDLDAQIGTNEVVLYISPGNMRFAATPDKKRESIVGAIAFTNQAVYIYNMTKPALTIQIDKGAFESVSYKAGGLAASKFDLYFKDASRLAFSGASDKTLAANLYGLINRIMTDTLEPQELAIPADKLKTYSVVYLGGDDNNPKEIYNIQFIIYEDMFEVKCKLEGKFHDFVIPYEDVVNLEIAPRLVSLVEDMLDRGDSRQLNQDNNIHITYLKDGEERVVRLEMITGVTVMGQAKVCREMIDFLRTNNILSKLKKTSQDAGNNSTDYIEQLQKLAELKDAGILTQEEFDAKKRQLLNL